MRGLILALVIGLSGWTNVVAQEWQNIPDASHRKSVVKILGENGVCGSGTVIKKIKDSQSHPDFYLGLILTASHCVDDLSILFEVEFFDGSKTGKNLPIKDLPIEVDPDNDLAIIRALIPNKVPVAEMSTEKVKCNEKVLLSGYGAGKVRHWAAKYGGKKLATGGHIIFSWAIQGDSGGPVVHNGKVIGVICYGSGLRKFKNSQRMIVCPVYASNVARIKDFVEGYSE